MTAEPRAPLRLVATCAPGLEPFLAAELEALAVPAIEPGRGAVRFTGGWPELWRANYWLRTASRVLVEIASFPAGTSEELYQGAAALLGHGPRERRGRAGARAPWRRGVAGADLAGIAIDRWLAPERTFAVAATSTRSRLRDTRWIALRIKDAIVDAQRDRFGRRADVDTERPEVPLRVWLHDDRAALLLDSSREPLDRRGYRRVSGAAPLRETLAAAIVLASGWDRRGPVVDPMCGTGTLLIEAGWIALGRAPGALRTEWVFTRWPGFDAASFARVRGEAPPLPVASPPGPGAPPSPDRSVSDSSPQPHGAGEHGVRLHGRDSARDAVRAACVNLDAAGLGGLARVEVGDGLDFEPPPGPGLVVVNPAYGARLETSDDEWRRLGDRLKRCYAGWRCAVIAGEPSFGKPIGLRPRRRWPVRNGPLDARILVFDLYPGRARPWESSED